MQVIIECKKLIRFQKISHVTVVADFVHWSFDRKIFENPSVCDWSKNHGKLKSESVLTLYPTAGVTTLKSVLALQHSFLVFRFAIYLTPT